MANSKQAFRSGSQLSIPPEDLDQTTPEVDEIKSEQDRENATFASLNGHPGWELIKQNFTATIARYRSGATIQEAISKGLTNEQVGELTRTSNAVADELEAIVLTVETAAAALEEDQNEEFKNAVKNAGLPEFDFDKAYDTLQEATKKNIQHTPRQQGPHIICVSCPHPHTLSYIGVNKNFKGVAADGSYILENRF